MHTPKTRNRTHPRFWEYTQYFDGTGFPSAFSLTIDLKVDLKKDDRVVVLLQTHRDQTTEKGIARVIGRQYREIPKCLLNATLTTDTAARLSLLCEMIQEQTGIEDNREVLASMVETFLGRVGIGKKDGSEPLPGIRILTGYKEKISDNLWEPSFVTISQSPIPNYIPKDLRPFMTDVEFYDQPPKEISDAWEQMLKAPVWNLEDFLSYWETTTYAKFLIEKVVGRVKEKKTSSSVPQVQRSQGRTHLLSDTSRQKASDSPENNLQTSDAAHQAKFLKNGDCWTITYQGESIPLKHIKGFYFLSYLLSHPGQTFSSLQLSEISGANRSRSVSPTQEFSQEEGATSNLSINDNLGDAGSILDEESKKRFKEHLAYLDKEIRKAERQYDRATLERLKPEKTIFIEKLAKAYGLKGMPRKDSDNSERARKAISNRIKDSLIKIEKEHPVLGLHLKNSLNTGKLFSYTPEIPTTWST